MGVIKVNDIPYAGGGSSNYIDLTNKPSINNVTLSGNKTAADLGVAAVTNGQDLTFFVQNGILCVSTPPEPLVPFSTATDAQIAGILDAYYSGDYTLAQIQEVWHVGDTRTIHLDAMQAPNPNSGNTWAAQDITITILDFNHTDLATPINGHSKAALTLQTREVLNNNSSFHNQTGHIYINGDSANDMSFTKWSNLYMRTYMNDKVYNAFPSEIKSAIKPSKHYRHTTYNGSESEQVTDNLFLPSYPEIFGTASYSDYVATSPVEGTQFAYYQTAANRIKYGNNNGVSNGVAQFWWEGSPCSYYSSDSSDGYYWCSVSTFGYAGGDIGSGAHGLAPAFCF